MFGRLQAAFLAGACLAGGAAFGASIAMVDPAAALNGQTALAIGPDALPVIAYREGIARVLKVARCGQPDCTGPATISVIDASGDVGQMNAIAVGADGLPVIAYHDAIGADLRLAKSGDAACAGPATITVLDSAGVVGWGPAVAIGADGFPVVAYYDATNYRLKVAKCANAACTASTLAAVADNGGWHLSMKVAADGLPLIAFTGGQGITVAKCATADCAATSSVTVLDTPFEGYVSVAFGKDGLPVVAYQDYPLGDLKLARCRDPACAGGADLVTVDSAGDVGYFSSVAVLPDGLPVIGHYARDRGDLKVARCVNAGCAGASAVSTVDSAGDVGAFISMAVGADGLPVMSYADRASGALKVAKCASPGCAEEFLVPHYYRSILRRDPDPAGAAFWESEAMRASALGIHAVEAWNAMSQVFYTSAEYAALGRDDAGFVADLYDTFFNRAPDAAGLAYWTGQLAAGLPREVLFAQFVFSPEFARFTAALLGTPARSADADAVTDFYRGILGRLPDGGGFAYWRERFRLAGCQGASALASEAEAISSAFTLSSEYAARARSATQYVGDLYNAFLRRGGDLGGVQFWINQIAAGARTREQVRAEFRNSPEFQARVQAIIQQGCMN